MKSTSVNVEAIEEQQLPRVIQPISGLGGVSKSKSKYKNETVTDEHGIKFDSKREYRRYLDLKLMQETGQITQLRRQVTFRLEVNGVRICDYVADFTYFDSYGLRIVEDVKGTITPEYKIKRQLMLAVHGIEIKET